jgi:hypothetical protein
MNPVAIPPLPKWEATRGGNDWLVTQTNPAPATAAIRIQADEAPCCMELLFQTRHLGGE